MRIKIETYVEFNPLSTRLTAGTASFFSGCPFPR
jgi:hypothetical protein